MITADIGDTISLTASLVNEETGLLETGKTVYYDIRDTLGNTLTPPLAGTMSESSVSNGIYLTDVIINTSGNYICYITCSGFLTSNETITINDINIYDLVKSTNNHNISVENILRLNVDPSASQLARNVPLGHTDYVITIVRPDGASDWSEAVTSGTVYAHYKTIDDTAPYKMGGAY